MPYPGPPRVGADRRSSDQDGLLANGVLGPRLESLPAPVLLDELNRGQPGRFRAPDTPLVRSLLAGIDDAGVPEAGARGRGVVAGQDAAAWRRKWSHIFVGQRHRHRHRPSP